MFKLDRVEDIDLEEDFLQEAFVKKKQPNQVTKLQQCGTDRLSIPNGDLQIKFPLRELQTKTTTVKNSSNEKLSRNVNGTVSVQPENDLEEFGDIDWNLCFEEDDLQQAAAETQAKKFNDRISAANKEEERECFKLCPPVQKSPVSNRSRLSTPTSLTPVQSRSWSANSSGRKRKFPGPAGLLPTQQNGSFSLHFPMDALTSDDSNDASKLTDISDSMLLSQVSDNPFESDPWRRMQKDLDLNGSDSHILKKYNIAWVLLKASSKGLPDGKVPILILVLKSFLEKGAEASVVFKDETGEIPGTIHRKVFEEFEDCLLTGAVLVVRKVSVFSPYSRKHYLNVNPSNMVCLYSPNAHKPKFVAEGVTNLRLQVREYALEPWMTPECVPIKRTPLGSNQSEDNRQPHLSTVNHVEKFRPKSEQPSVKAQEPAKPVTNLDFEEEFVQDDELDKFLEELENDFD